MGEKERRDKAVFYIKLIELFGECYQSKIAAVSQNTVATMNVCIGEKANTSNPVGWQEQKWQYLPHFYPCKSHATLAQGIPTQWM